jgi:predicted nucleotidyltransferase
MKITRRQLESIKALCQKSKVKSLVAFGSVLRDDFNDDSDIDLAVDFNETDPFNYTDLYFELKNELENILRRKIDLIESRSIRNKFFKDELDKTKLSIYGQ